MACLRRRDGKENVCGGQEMRVESRSVLSRIGGEKTTRAENLEVQLLQGRIIEQAKAKGHLSHVLSRKHCSLVNNGGAYPLHLYLPFHKQGSNDSGSTLFPEPIVIPNSRLYFYQSTNVKQANATFDIR